jgi:hypothetical protein
MLLGGESGGRLLVLPAILLAALLYAVAVFLTRSVTEEDIRMLPGGKRLASVLYSQKQTV